MIGKEVKESKPVSIHAAKKILKDQKGETYEQKVALEHAEKLSTITDAKAEKLHKALVDTGLLHEITTLKVVEIMPKSMPLLRQILSRERKAFTDDEVKRIMAIVKEHA